MSYDPYAQFDPQLAQILRDVFQAEISSQFQPFQDAHEDRELAIEEDRLRSIYPDYDRHRVAILQRAIATGTANLEDVYHDHALALEEQQLRQVYGSEYDKNRVAILEHAVEHNVENLEQAVQSFRDTTWSAPTDAQAQKRAERMEELRLRPDVASQVERRSLELEERQEREQAFVNSLKSANRAERRQESIANSNREAAIRNDRRTERVRAGKIDLEHPSRLDREALDRQAEDKLIAANEARESSERGGVGSHPDLGL